MAPLAITLGLEPLHPEEKKRVPRRARVEEVLQPDGTLPADCIYVGLGHHAHRLPTSCWKSPWVPGHSCSYDEWLVLYVQHICMGPLWFQLGDLVGRRLVCDCAWQSLCEADVLAGLCFEQACPQQRQPEQGHQGNSRTRGVPRTVQFLASASYVASGADSLSIPLSLPQRSQEATVLLFQKLFPGLWFEGFQFPMIEDLINQAPFGCFEQWLSERAGLADGPLGPMLTPPSLRHNMKSCEAQQAGAFNQRAALPPLLPFGLTPDEHFSAAHQQGRLPLPTEHPARLDLDLQFAAAMTATLRGQLRNTRSRMLGVLKELHRRWQPVTKHLRSFQPEGIRRVTAARDLGFTSLLVILCSWPDASYPFGLIRGLPAVGYAPCYGIFPELFTGRISFEEVMGDWQQHNFEIEARIRPGPDDEFALSQSCVDADKGFCTYPLTRSELQRSLGGSAFRLIPRCVITQSSGKQRVIDDAFRGGQSETSRDCNDSLALHFPGPPLHSGEGLSGIWRGGLARCISALSHVRLRSITLCGRVAKLYGLANFCEQGIFGRVGNGVLHAVKERQYERERELTPSLVSCFQMLEAIIRAKPRREFPVIPTFCPRFCAASDAALEQPFCGTGGFLIVWYEGEIELREAFVANIPSQIYALWSPGEKKIAQLELSQALYALVNRPDRGRRGIWFIDNLAALMALIKGRSDSPDLERLAHLIHLACFALRVWIYWEYIPSKSNWADAISRLGENDPWYKTHGFVLSQAHFPLILWSLPFSAVVLIFEMI